MPVREARGTGSDRLDVTRDAVQRVVVRCVLPLGVRGIGVEHLCRTFAGRRFCVALSNRVTGPSTKSPVRRDREWLERNGLPILQVAAIRTSDVADASYAFKQAGDQYRVLNLCQSGPPDPDLVSDSVNPTRIVDSKVSAFDCAVPNGGWGVHPASPNH